MQCSSYIPVYYHARDLNAGATVFSWHPFDTNNNSVEEKGYDKEVLKQMIQNHEATFRYQVQELHRLYRRQRELMDETRVKEILAQHLPSQTSESVHSLSQARSETPSHATSWFLGDLPRNPSIFFSGNYQESAMTQPDSFMSKKSCQEVKFLLSSSKENENRIMDLQLPADIYEGKQFKEGHHSEAPNFEPASDSDNDSVKIRDPSGLHLNSRKKNCFIDLNEPIQLESLPSSSSGPAEYSHMEIDLNSMPASCFSETEIGESCTNDPTMKNEELVEDHPFVDNKINKKFVKNGFEIDLNTGLEDEHSPPCTILEIKMEDDAELVGPVSPENEECSPPRGKSEVETPEQGEGEPSVELDDTFAAQTLVTISLQDQEYYTKKSLCWFAEIISSIGVDLDGEITKLKNNAAEKDFEASRSKRGKGLTRGRKQDKASSLTKGPFKRRAGRKGCSKPRKYSMSSILKQPAAVHLQGWGQIRKRQGGRRRRSTKFLVSFS